MTTPTQGPRRKPKGDKRVRTRAALLDAALRFSRGAYPARAMSKRAFDRLPGDLQALLLASKPVWEKALNGQISRADKAGLEFATTNKVEIIPFPQAEQAKLDTLYNRYAIDQAKRLSAFGIDGTPVFKEAQRLIAAGSKPCPAQPIGNNRPIGDTK